MDQAERKQHPLLRALELLESRFPTPLHPQGGEHGAPHQRPGQLLSAFASPDGWGTTSPSSPLRPPSPLLFSACFSMSPSWEAANQYKRALCPFSVVCAKASPLLSAAASMTSI